MTNMKGNIDLMGGIGAFFATILVVWILTVIWQSNFFNNGTFRQAIAATPQANTVINESSGFFTGLNTVLAFLFIFTAIGACVAAAFTESNPFFAAIGIMFLPVELVLAFGFHDAFMSLITNSAFGSLAVQYPMVYTTFQYLPVATLILSVLIAIITFSR